MQVQAPSRLGRLWNAALRWMSPVVDPASVWRGLKGYAWFFRDYRRYRRMEGAETLRLAEAFPLVHDKVDRSPIDAHYYWQDNWALRRVVDAKPRRHVDVGSRVDTVSHVAAFTPTVFVDIRPLDARVDGLDSVAGNITSLPFRDGSVESLSCLHVAEHIGLGRYGDPLDPHGTRKAAAELKRVLAPGGNLYFALPVGRERVAFNANRVHAPETIARYFEGLELVEFGCIDDAGRFRRNEPFAAVEGASYACGLFWFRAPASTPARSK